jgi:hypothetical protein
MKQAITAELMRCLLAYNPDAVKSRKDAEVLHGYSPRHGVAA